MKLNLLLLVVMLAGMSGACMPEPTFAEKDFEQVLAQAYESQQSDLQIQGWGKVIRLLEDDLTGSRHQRFIIELGTGQTLLVAHNIDLAPRIEGLTSGDEVAFYGEYEWNAKGGVIHWTHHDPQGKHPDGWLKHKGGLYR